MLLSELQTGESGVVVRVAGHGAFRKRIIEMGFIKGSTVEAVLNAPLNDPIKYRIMNFEVSLRRSDAEKVEIVTEAEAEADIVNHDDYRPFEAEETKLHHVAEERSRTINVALVGNPNCGKTSIFNVAAHAHERVGNYSGVTVDEKVGTFKYGGYTFNLTDLPGTYSLSAYSPEELYVRRHIIEKNPDIILNVLDASNLERNLYLTTQLIDMDITMVMALNMYDELKRSGDQLDIDQLSTLLGMPIVPTTGRSGEGIGSLFDKIIEVFEGSQSNQSNRSSLNNQKALFRHIHVNHGPAIESCIKRLRTELYEHGFSDTLSTRFLAIKLLENDSALERYAAEHDPDGSVLRMRDRIAEEYKKGSGRRLVDNEDGKGHKVDVEAGHQDIESAITDAKYAFVRGALAECYRRNEKSTLHSLTDRLDAIITHRWLGYPVFLLFMFITFWCTFTLGAYPMDWIDALFGWLGERVGELLPEGLWQSLVVDGIITDVGSVLVFLPNILILYLFISFMEDSGYMARAAFIMDKLMHRMGLHGKSFIPMIMGFGCNVPAIMATRTIEDRKSRMLTMLVIPMMSCSARIPVYVILCSAFFSTHAAYVIMGLYLLGMVMSVLMAKLFSRYFVKGESLPFVMELPPYRMPTAKAVLRHTWEKGKEYLKKMATIILGASIIVWALTYFPHHEDAKLQAENSYMAKIGKTIEPALRPCGFDWRQSVSLLSGMFAKEVVASTMTVVYATSSEEAEALEDFEAEENEMRIAALIRDNMSPLSAFCMLLFILLYMPCLSTVVAIRNESGRWKWALFTVVYTIGLAWLVSAAVFQLGSLLL